MSKKTDKPRCPHCCKPISGKRDAHVRACRPHNKAFAVIDIDGHPFTRGFRHGLDLRLLDDREQEAAFIELRRQPNNDLSLTVWVDGVEVSHVAMPKKLLRNSREQKTRALLWEFEKQFPRTDE